MKIGIMGGTFDPIHNGHLMLAEFACRDYALDQVWFMPNGHPPHKDNRMIGSTPAQRARMVQLAIEDHRQFRLEDYELNRKEISCSYSTMEHFRALRPKDRFYFIVGADSLFSIESWVHVERLFPTCTLLAAYRDDKSSREVMGRQIHYLERKYNADIRLLNTPLVDISSHELRQMMRERKDVRDLMPEAVYSYICINGLYTS